VSPLDQLMLFLVFCAGLDATRRRQMQRAYQGWRDSGSTVEQAIDGVVHGDMTTAELGDWCQMLADTEAAVVPENGGRPP
jgi:hypothetical protein